MGIGVGAVKPVATTSTLQIPQITHTRSAHHEQSSAHPPPPEILNFIEKQEGYIEQLERESQFCRVRFKKINKCRSD